MSTNTANTPSETVTVVSAKAAESFDMTAPETFSLESPGSETSAERKKLRPLRFATGLCLTTFGMGMVLLVAGSGLTGVTLLGGGFGLMATASSGFDEQEFDRLARAGNISAVVMSTETNRFQEDEMAA